MGDTRDPTAVADVLAEEDGVSAASVRSSPAVVPAAQPDRLGYLEALARASNALNATLEQDKVLSLLAQQAAELLGVDAASVMLVEDDRVSIRAAYGLSPLFLAAQSRQPLEKSIAGRALAEGRIFATWDARQGQNPTIDAEEAVIAEGIVAAVCAPMQFHRKAVGALNLYCRTPHCFSEDQFHVLALLAAQGAVAVTNAQLYQESQTHASEVRASFRRVGAALASSLDLAETLRLIVLLAVEITRSDGGAIYLLADDREGGGLVLSGARGLDRRSIRRFRRVPPSPLVERALAERRVIVVPDTRRYAQIPFPALHAVEGASPTQEDDARETRSVVCAPILHGDQPVGVLEQYADQPNRFGKNEMQLLSSFALHASVAIENARLYAQERNVAQTLQRSFLPELPPTVSGFEIGRIYAPASRMSAVGGDTYDLLTLPDGRLVAVIADACGKGAQAATLAVMAKYTLRAYALEDPDPATVLRRVNQALIPQTEDSTFITLCCAVLDPNSRRIEVASAAHPPALRCKAGDGVRTCEPLGDAPGLICGFLPGQEYPADSAELKTGDVVVFYTDGVLEARRRKVMFGRERLEKVIADSADLGAQEIAAAIHAAVAQFTGDHLTDDIALLVLKVL